MNVSVLVSYRPDGGQRDVNWAWIEARWKALFPEYELVVSSDKGKSKDFNQGQAYNLAAKKASGDIFLITCPDVAFNREHIVRAVAHCAESDDWLLPQCYHQLTKRDSRRLLRERPDALVLKPQRTERSWYEESLAEIVVVPAKAYWKVGGYDERYPTWGWIDKVFATTMNTLYRPFERYVGAMYHLWHPRPEILPDSNSALTKLYLKADGQRREIRRLIRA